MVPDIVLERKEEWFYEWDDNYDVGVNLYTPMKGNEMEGSHTFNVDNSVLNLPKTKHHGKLKTRIVSEVSNSNNKSDFTSANVNHKYWTFETNY